VKTELKGRNYKQV